MRSERRRVLFLLWFPVCFLAGTVLGQAPPSESGDEAPQLDEIKIIAQTAALAHLGGEKPFILRESSWSGEVDPGKSKLIQVHLFKRNDYHFWFAVADRQAGLDLSLYNGKGELVAGEVLDYSTPNVVSLVVTPSETGLYYLRVSLRATVEQAQPWSVIYAYR